MPPDGPPGQTEGHEGDAVSAPAWHARCGRMPRFPPRSVLASVAAIGRPAAWLTARRTAGRSSTRSEFMSWSSKPVSISSTSRRRPHLPLAASVRATLRQPAECTSTRAAVCRMPGPVRRRMKSPVQSALRKALRWVGSSWSLVLPQPPSLTPGSTNTRRSLPSRTRTKEGPR